MPFWVTKTKYLYCLGVATQRQKERERKEGDWKVHSAQRRGKTCENGREQRNESREIIKGDRGKNIKRGARKTNQKSQVKGGVASVGNSKSKKRKEGDWRDQKSKSEAQKERKTHNSSENNLEVIGIES